MMSIVVLRSTHLESTSSRAPACESVVVDGGPSHQRTWWWARKSSLLQLAAVYQLWSKQFSPVAAEGDCTVSKAAAKTSVTESFNQSCAHDSSRALALCVYLRQRLREGDLGHSESIGRRVGWGAGGSANYMCAQPFAALHWSGCVGVGELWRRWEGQAGDSLLFRYVDNSNVRPRCGCSSCVWSYRKESLRLRSVMLQTSGKTCQRIKGK